MNQCHGLQLNLNECGSEQSNFRSPWSEVTIIGTFNLTSPRNESRLAPESNYYQLNLASSFQIYLAGLAIANSSAKTASDCERKSCCVTQTSRVKQKIINSKTDWRIFAYK